MDSIEQKKAEHVLKRLVKKGFFQDKKVFFFGASDHTRQVIQSLREYQIEPEGILDNDKKKRNEYCARVKVILPEDVQNPSDKKYVYLICSPFWREMRTQLMDCGVGKGHIAYFNVWEESFFALIYNAYKGKQIYRRLLKKYGDLPILFCPYTGTGDVYLSGTFLEQYIRQEEIRDFVFLVVNNACGKVAGIFQIDNVETLRFIEESIWLIDYYRLCPSRIPLKILNDSWKRVHANKLEWFRGYNGWNFMELFRTFVFNLPDEARPQTPVLADAGEEVEKLFRENGLKASRTVVISPYANTLADLPDSFWSVIVDYLKENGYAVCTNCGGKHEPPLAGTVPVFFSLTVAPQFIERAGYFIGVRSGLCDVISAAKAKKIILYDRDNWFYNCKAYEYFSLNHMGLCDDAIEIEFDNQKLDQCREEILGYF